MVRFRRIYGDRASSFGAIFALISRLNKPPLYGIRLITYRSEHQRQEHERSISDAPQSLRHYITGFRITRCRGAEYIFILVHVQNEEAPCLLAPKGDPKLNRF
jgi:hypothetical protein